MAAAGGAGIAALLAVVYAYAILYIPIAGYVGFILSGAFGLAMGATTGMLLRHQKVRSVRAANLVVAGVAVLGLYVSWAVWAYALLRRAEVEDARLLPILLNPVTLGQLVRMINESGAWSIKNFSPSGFTLAMISLAEGVLIFVAAAMSGVSSVSSVSSAVPSRVEQVGAATRMGYRTTSRGPRDASEALRFAAFRALPGEAGVQIRDRSGATRELTWTDLREIVVLQLPNDQPWAAPIVIDLIPVSTPVPMRLVTGSFIEWKGLPGDATPSPVENVRKLCRLAIERNPQIVMDDATRRFSVEGAPCRRLLGMRLFAEYDARYG